MQKAIQRAASLLDRLPELIKTDVRIFELNRRFLWFIVFRFVVVAVLIFLAITKPYFFHHIAVERPTLVLMALFLLLFNALYWMHYGHVVKSPDLKLFTRRLSLNVHVQIILDFIVLGILACLCGGIESPLVYFFLFHCVISCLFFRKLVSFAHMVLALLIVYFISLSQLFGFVNCPHFVFPAEAAALYSNNIVYSYYLAGVTAVYFVVWFFAANITDSLKVHEHRLQDKIDELEEMDREKTRYMLVTTHELKAPFSSIQSYVNVLLDGYAGDISDKVGEIMLKIKARCAMLMRMITEMLQLTNLSSLKKKEVAMESVDIVKIIEKVVLRFKAIAAAKNVKIVPPAGASFELVANAEQLDILFNNILSNAINYCYPDTEVDIGVRLIEDNLKVAVSDKGIGIKKEHLDKVFQEYFRSEKATLVNKDSTGLGLPIAKRIMELHGGRIWIESKEDVGTTVFMEF